MVKVGGQLTLVITVVILFVVLFQVLAEMIPELNTAGNSLNATGIPFGSFFAENGLIVLLLIVGIVLLAVKLLLPSK